MLFLLVFVFALSMDSFIISFIYGIKGIRIPLLSIFLLALIETSLLGFSIFLTNFLYFGPIYTSISYLLFMIIGIYNLLMPFIKYRILVYKNKMKCLSSPNMAMMVDVYLDETKADFDQSKSLNGKEACCLGFFLSLDSCLSGVAFASLSTLTPALFLLRFSVGFLAIVLGGKLGRRLTCKHVWMGNVISGILFLMLAFMRMFEIV